MLNFAYLFYNLFSSNVLQLIIKDLLEKSVKKQIAEHSSLIELCVFIGARQLSLIEIPGIS